MYVLNPKVIFMRVNKGSGFTLIEMVIGIIVFSIALALFASLIIPQAIRSVDPIFQVRAAELGQSLINEIASKSFDENSSRTGGLVRCNEIDPITLVLTPCSVINSITNSNIEEGINNRNQFDDVDDYNNLNESGDDIKNALGNTSGLYAGFNVLVSVAYDANMDGIPDVAIGNTKLITVIVTTPNSEDIIFSTFRSNY